LLFALGTDLREAKDRWSEIKIANRRGEDLSRFKPEKKNKVAPESEPMKFRRYAEIYLGKPEAQALKSHRRDRDFVNHLNEIFGDLLLTDIKRLKDFVVRYGKPSKSRVSRGEITNELSCLRKILRAAQVDEYPVAVPSFADKSSKKNERLMWRHPGRDRILEQEEEQRLMEHYPLWLQRTAIFARETALNQGDCTEADGVVDPERAGRHRHEDGWLVVASDAPAIHQHQAAPRL